MRNEIHRSSSGTFETPSRVKRKSPNAPKDGTSTPCHLPDLGAIRFTSIAQRAHGYGEPGFKGGVLADALAAPPGFSLSAALVTAQSCQAYFVWAMLQTASVADGAPPEMSREMGMQAASFACEPEAVADVIAFLASDDARHINGAGIRVDNTSTIHAPYW